MDRASRSERRCLTSGEGLVTHSPSYEGLRDLWGEVEAEKLVHLLRTVSGSSCTWNRLMGNSSALSCVFSPVTAPIVAQILITLFWPCTVRFDGNEVRWTQWADSDLSKHVLPSQLALALDMTGLSCLQLKAVKRFPT